MKSAAALAAVSEAPAAAATAPVSAPSQTANCGFCMLRRLPRQAPVDMHVHDVSFSDIVCGVCVVDNSVRTNRVHADDVRGEAVVNDTSSEYFNSP